MFLLTQTRLSMHLESSLSDYEGKHMRKETSFREKWDTAWKAAEFARTQHTLTPELVDDVRRAL